MQADIGGTGFSASGDSAAVFASGPIGLWAVIGAKLHGAGSIIAADANPHRLQTAIRMGATHTIDIRKEDSVAVTLRLTRGRGLDVRHRSPRAPADVPERPPGDLSSLGVYSGTLPPPSESSAAGLGDHKVVTTLRPGGKERVRRLMELVRHRRFDLTRLLTTRTEPARI